MGLIALVVATVLATALGATAEKGAGTASVFAQADLPGGLMAKAAAKESGAPQSAGDIRRLTTILSTAVDRKLLTASAAKLAASGQANAVHALARFLVDGRFLRRLDAVDVPDLKLANLSHVLATLAAHPNQASEDLGLAMLESRDVQADPDRNGGVLAVLASVRPMSERVEQALRKTNAAGYWQSNALLLVANASPRALALFSEMAGDARVPTEDRVDMIRWAIPAHRHLSSVVECVSLLLARGLDAEVDQALFEALFDFGGDRWFGKARQPPSPQPWAKTESRVLQMYLNLGERLLQTRVPPSAAMRAAIDRTAHEIRTELAARTPNRQ